MGLRVLTRKKRMDLVSAEGDICELLFSRKRAQKACRLFLQELKRHNGLSRAEVSRFAWDLQLAKLRKTLGKVVLGFIVRCDVRC